MRASSRRRATARRAAARAAGATCDHAAVARTAVATASSTWAVVVSSGVRTGTYPEPVPVTWRAQSREAATAGSVSGAFANPASVPPPTAGRGVRRGATSVSA